MRRRLGNFLSIVLIALAVQIFALIGACWAASIAASDPVDAAPISSGGAASTLDQTVKLVSSALMMCCAMCRVAHAAASLDMPEATSFATLIRQSERLVWLDAAPEQFSSGTGWHAQARAPPSIS